MMGDMLAVLRNVGGKMLGLMQGPGRLSSVAPMTLPPCGAVFAFLEEEVSQVRSPHHPSVVLRLQLGSSPGPIRACWLSSLESGVFCAEARSP